MERSLEGAVAICFVSLIEAGDNAEVGYINKLIERIVPEVLRLHVIMKRALLMDLKYGFKHLQRHFDYRLFDSILSILSLLCLLGDILLD